VAPPSIWKDDPADPDRTEQVVWHTFTRPADVDFVELIVAVRSVAAVALLARHWPAKGSLHDARLALSGALTRAGWSEDRVTAFVRAVTIAAGNRGIRDAESVAESTDERVDDGKTTWGWPTLEELLGEKGPAVCKRVREWLGIADKAPPEIRLPVEPPWPSPLAAEALHGLAGDIVRIIEPHTEADPVAILVQLQVGFGNLIGRTAHFQVEGDVHYLNEFAVLVGRTSKARKGTSWGHSRRLLAAVEQQFADQHIHSGLSSGQGLIWAVRDPITKRERIKERGEPVRYEEVEADPGISDKRLLVYEPEFARVLHMIEGQEGNCLSAVLRQAWDGIDLGIMNKNSPARATGAHISGIFHITAEELRRYLSTTEAANGYGNRHLWFCVKRARVLPDGGSLPLGALDDAQRRLAEAVTHARGTGTLRRDAGAGELWRGMYSELSAERPGMSGAMLARAEAHTMRLACLYALLDLSKEVRAEHLLAAVALWQYVEESVRHVFGDRLGDPVADELLLLLRGAPQGLTRTEISNFFGRHRSSDRLGRALGLLLQHKLARPEKQVTDGRHVERWFACR
jgi:hypothetical protein